MERQVFDGFLHPVSQNHHLTVAAPVRLTSRAGGDLLVASSNQTCSSRQTRRVHTFTENKLVTRMLRISTVSVMVTVTPLEPLMSTHSQCFSSRTALPSRRRSAELLTLMLTWSAQVEGEAVSLLHHLMASAGPDHRSRPEVKSCVVSLAVVKHGGVGLHPWGPQPRPPVWGAADLVAAGDLHRQEV